MIVGTSKTIEQDVDVLGHSLYGVGVSHGLPLVDPKYHKGWRLEKPPGGRPTKNRQWKTTERDGREVPSLD